ncbi:unnamed protein product [Lactuca saligna]|uniref:DUF4283 domain-containing protein n=1 Tax=Lactuca saligna TaxID=75948 RepID=A0AA36ENF9_LACSI|nr:unnamed protein product [Lactuca saligna]
MVGIGPASRFLLASSMVGIGPGSRSWTQVATVADVYIAKKLSKLGKCFAFVRFIKVSDEKLLEIKIREIWLGSYHLFVSLARFQRESDRKRQSDSHVHGDQVVSKINGKGQESYATVVKGGKGMHELKEPKSTVCTLSGKEICNNMSLKASMFAKLRDIRLIQNLFVLLKEEGFDALQIKYVASDWVCLTFLSEEVCARFKKCNGIKAYFSLFRPVVNGFFVKERAVWIEMIGLPCCAWNDDVVSKVASMWGDVCFLDDDGDASLAIKRACIKTYKPGLIHETVKVVAQGNQEAGFVDRKFHFFQTSGRKKKVDRCFEDDEWVKSILVDASVKLPTRPERDSSSADEEIRQGGVVGGGASESLSQSPGF